MVVTHLTIQIYEIYGYDQSIILHFIGMFHIPKQVRIVQHTSLNNPFHLRKPLPSYGALPILTILRSNHSRIVKRYTHHTISKPIRYDVHHTNDIIIVFISNLYLPDYPIWTHGILRLTRV